MTAALDPDTGVATWSIERYEQIARMTRAHMTDTEIATRLGITRRTVSRARVRMGMGRPLPKPITDDEIAIAAAMFNDGASRSDVARTLGRSPAVFRRRFPECKWTHQQGVEQAVLVRRLKQLEHLA